VAGKNGWNQYRIERNKKLINYLIFKAILPLSTAFQAAIFHHIRATFLQPHLAGGRAEKGGQSNFFPPTP
jgi:hypothetical protein